MSHCSSTEKDDTKVIDLGGSLVAPAEIDTRFLGDFVARIGSYLAGNPARRLIIVVGGGRLARVYQQAYRHLVDAHAADSEDWIGIAATRLNAELLRYVFQNECLDEVVCDPSVAKDFTGRVLIGAGWKPGFSTDYDAVILAERFSASTVIRLTNTPKIYSADPKKDPSARPIDRIGWTQYSRLAGGDWVPGANTPFDAMASKRASRVGLRVIVADGKNLDNMISILEDRNFEGTVIGPDQ